MRGMFCSVLMLLSVVTYSQSQQTPMNQLIHAIKVGDLKKVQDLVQAGVNVNGREGKYEWTPLIYACSYDRPEIVKFLIQEGADVNESDAIGVTALDIAVSGQLIDIARILLQHGADADCKTARTKREKARFPMLASTPITSAAKNGNLELMDLLLKHGADVNLGEPKRTPQDTALSAAARLGRRHVSVVHYLLLHGADALSLQGTIALEYAVNARSLPMVKMLLQAGADPNHANVLTGVTPLAVAVENGDYRIAEELIKAGADVDADLSTGKYSKYPGMTVRDLIKQKGDPDLLLLIKEPPASASPK